MNKPSILKTKKHHQEASTLFSKSTFSNSLCSLILNNQSINDDSIQPYLSQWIIIFLLLVAVISIISGFTFLLRRMKQINITSNTHIANNNDVLVSRIIDEISKNNQYLEPMATLPKKNSAIRKVPEKISSQIVKQLKMFEKKEEFLNPELKLTKLAEQFGTNTKYLSKVIYQEHGKPYKAYIRDLKVAFAKSKIDSNYKFRRYKIEVIAIESGFKTGESFSKAFLDSFGIYPSKYIKKVERKSV